MHTTLFLGASLVWVNCGSTPDFSETASEPQKSGGASGAPGTPIAPVKFTSVFDGLAKGEQQRLILCARGNNTRIEEVFCSPTRPFITNLAQLREALMGGPEFKVAVSTASGGIDKMAVSALNHRAVIFHDIDANRPPVVMAFNRSHLLSVEVIARDTVTGQLRPYLIRFYKACEKTAEGCSNGDLYGPSVERDWDNQISIYSGDDDLDNTVVACRVCHQPSKDGPRVLRMFQLQANWNQWLSSFSANSIQLTQEFSAQRAGETFAGIPAAQIVAQDRGPEELEKFIRFYSPVNGDQLQNELPPQVETEVVAQPTATSDPRLSPSWAAIYDDVFVQGLGLAPTAPWNRGIRDPQKFADMGAAYQAFKQGTLPGADLPDLAEPNFASLEWAAGKFPEPGKAGQQLLNIACGMCHPNNTTRTLDPVGHPRRNFSVNLASMGKGHLALAIARLKRDADDIKLMPPKAVIQLTPAQKTSLVNFLQNEFDNRP